MNPMGYVNEGYRLAAESYASMDRARKEIRTEEPPPHSAWGALENTAGGAFAGYELGHLLGEAGIKIPGLLGGGGEAATQAASAAESTKGALGLNPWTTLLGAGLGLLSYLFS